MKPLLDFIRLSYGMVDLKSLVYWLLFLMFIYRIIKKFSHFRWPKWHIRASFLDGCLYNCLSLFMFTEGVASIQPKTGALAGDYGADDYWFSLGLIIRPSLESTKKVHISCVIISQTDERYVRRTEVNPQ